MREGVRVCVCDKEREREETDLNEVGVLGQSEKGLECGRMPSAADRNAVVNPLALLRRKCFAPGTGNSVVVVSELKLHVLNLLAECKSEFSMEFQAVV